jgi:hypothetical protein
LVNPPGGHVYVGNFRGSRLFVALATPNTIKTSTDGRIWTTRYMGPPGGNPLNAVVIAGE